MDSCIDDVRVLEEVDDNDDVDKLSGSSSIPLDKFLFSIRKQNNFEMVFILSSSALSS